MKTSHFIKSSLAALAIAATFVPAIAMAQVDNPFQKGGLLVNNVAGNAGITSTQTLPVIIGRIINVALTFLGIIFLVLVLYAGFLWMTAQGDSKQVDKSKDMLKQAIMGLVIIVAAYAISNFVLTSLMNVTQA